MEYSKQAREKHGLLILTIVWNAGPVHEIANMVRLLSDQVSVVLQVLSMAFSIILSQVVIAPEKKIQQNAAK
jgi:hypothetical protein